MSRTITVPVYAQVQPKIRKQAYQSPGVYADQVEDATVVAITKTRPVKPKPGTFLIKLKLRIPENAFLPFVPEALITIPENEFEPIVSVEAEDPREVD